MKKIIYLLFISLFVFTSCNQGDEIIDTTLKKGKQDQITIVGMNNPLVDPATVQNAVDNHDLVILSGTFDFGFDNETGGVDITRPNVILKGPATIVNGAKLTNIETIGTLPFPLSIHATGVEVRDLSFRDNIFGILVDVPERGKHVILDNNNIESNAAAIVATSTEGGIKVLNNELEAENGYFGRYTTGYTAIIDNNITAFVDGVTMINFDHRLDILNNTINMSSTSFTGIWLGAWRVTEETGPDWGDNPPVRIIGNYIELSGLDPAGIGLGTSAHGINNAMVRNNTLTGIAGYGGLLKEPYGSHNTFMNNDLSGLTTYSPQIWVHGGHNNHYKNNKLGKVEPFWLAGWAPAIRSAATLVSTLNWHYRDNYLNTPDPLNYGNHFSNNDYRQTGVPGWSDDPEDIGAVLLLDFLQRFDANFDPHEPISFAMRNFVNEKKFPLGTDLCDQILDLSKMQGDDIVPGTNHIAGWRACEAHAAKATYKSVREDYENLGKAMKERHLNRMKAREKKLEELGLSDLNYY